MEAAYINSLRFTTIVRQRLTCISLLFRQIDDQMKLLENCWSELLLLDIVYKQLEHNQTHQLLMVSISDTTLCLNEICSTLGHAERTSVML
jgi:hypothetical protein